MPPQRRFNPKLGADGFLTVDSLRTAVLELTGEDGEETIKSELLIFQTPKQRSWPSTMRRLSIIQTLFPLDRTLPLDFGVSHGAGIVRFAAEDTWWYYS